MVRGLRPGARNSRLQRRWPLPLPPEDRRKHAMADLFGLLLAAGGMGPDVEPHLQDVRDGRAVADDCGAEDRLPKGGNTHINVRPLFGAFRRKPHLFQNVAVEALEIEVLRGAVYEAES